MQKESTVIMKLNYKQQKIQTTDYLNSNLKSLIGKVHDEGIEKANEEASKLLQKQSGNLHPAGTQTFPKQKLKKLIKWKKN